MDKHKLHQIDPEIIRLTRIKSRQLAGRYGFARHDAEDLQQYLLLDYLRRSRKFEVHRSRRLTYARMVINNRVATIIAAQGASCRDYRTRVLSLNQAVEPGVAGSPELIDMLAADLGPSNDQVNRALDIEFTLRRLPSALAQLCRVIMITDTAAEAAAMAGISRATFYRSIRWIRAAFSGAGFVVSRRQPDARKDPESAGPGRREGARR